MYAFHWIKVPCTVFDHLNDLNVLKYLSLHTDKATNKSGNNRFSTKPLF